MDWQAVEHWLAMALVDEAMVPAGVLTNARKITIITVDFQLRIAT